MNIFKDNQEAESTHTKAERGQKLTQECENVPFRTIPISGGETFTHGEAGNLGEENYTG